MLERRRNNENQYYVHYKQNNISIKPERNNSHHYKKPNTNLHKHFNLQNVFLLTFLFFLLQTILINNTNTNTNTTLQYRVTSSAIYNRKKPQKYCKFIPFDKKDNKTYYLQGWEDVIYSQMTQRRNEKRRQFLDAQRNVYRHVKVFNKDSMGHRRLDEIMDESYDTNVVNNENKEQIYFIHIGKTGGSSLACNIKVARIHTPTCKKVMDRQKFFGTENKKEPAISRYITKRFHIVHPDTNASKYVISIRNPVERIKSWFLFEHPR